MMVLSIGIKWVQSLQSKAIILSGPFAVHSIFIYREEQKIIRLFLVKQSDESVSITYG
jgi:hypothetical protein